MGGCMWMHVCVCVSEHSGECVLPVGGRVCRVARSMLLPIKCHSGFAWTSWNNAVKTQHNHVVGNPDCNDYSSKKNIALYDDENFHKFWPKNRPSAKWMMCLIFGFILRGPFFKLCFWLGWNCGHLTDFLYMCVCDSGSCVECQHSVSYLFPIPAVSKGQHADFKWIMRRVVDVDRGHRWCHGSSVAVDGSRGRSRVRIQQLPGWHSGALSTAPFPGVCAIWAVLTLVMG